MPVQAEGWAHWGGGTRIARSRALRRLPAVWASGWRRLVGASPGRPLRRSAGRGASAGGLPQLFQLPPRMQSPHAGGTSWPRMPATRRATRTRRAAPPATGRKVRCRRAPAQGGRWPSQRGGLRSFKLCPPTLAPPPTRPALPPNPGPRPSIPDPALCCRLPLTEPGPSEPSARHVTFVEHAPDDSVFHPPVSEASQHIYFKDLKLLARPDHSSSGGRGLWAWAEDQIRF